ncbi:MAG TPA: hypothetical protein VGE21_11245 [Flavobacteriales bacterium]
MKLRYALFLSGLSLCLVHHAQVGVLNSNEMGLPGTSVTLSAAATALDLDFETGEGVTWDFSDLSPTGIPFNNEVRVPSTGAHISQFPSANFLLYEGALARYAYYSRTPSALERVGSYSASNGLRTFSDPQIELVFPLEIDVVNSDTWQHSASLFPGTLDLMCIGTGTLILPDMVRNDVLLLELANATAGTLVEQYQWIDATNGMILVNHVAEGFFVPTAMTQFATNLVVGIGEEHEALDMRIHSVAADQLFVTYTSTDLTDWTMTDASGRQVAMGRLPAQPAAATQALDVSALPSGIYVLELRDQRAGTRMAQRFFRDRAN